MTTTPALVAHIWRRLGFGGTRPELDAAEAAGPQATVAGLLSRPTIVPTAASPNPWQLATPADASCAVRLLEVAAFGRSAPGSATVAADYNPLQERLAWMLQGLVVVGQVDTVSVADLVDHVTLLRSSTHGSYRTLLGRVSTRPGMVKYLTIASNSKGHPNENYARELMELFSIGRVDVLDGTANYTQGDVREIARALTGWIYNWTTGKVSFDPNRWDAGEKTFHGVSLGGAGASQVIEALSAHPSWQRFVPARCYKELTGLDATPVVLDEIGPAFGVDGDLLALVTAIVGRPEFLSDEAIRSRTKCPVELVVGAARILGSPAISQNPSFGWYLARLGQSPFVPPNVSGWPRGDQWTNAANLVVWSAVVNDMVRRGLDWAGNAVGPVCAGIEQLFTSASAATATTAVLRLAGIEDATPNTIARLQAYATAGTWSRGRAAGLFGLVLLSPEFLVG